MYVGPPAITAIEVTKVCTNDFTVSWTAASNEEGLSYSVTLLPLNISVNTIVDSAYNFTGLLPANSYVVNVFSILSNCLGNPTTTMVTTLPVEEGVSQSELAVVNTYIYTYVPLINYVRTYMYMHMYVHV